MALSWDELSTSNPNEVSWDSLSVTPPAPTKTGLLGTIAEGAKTAVRSLGATADLYQGDNKELGEAALAQQSQKKDSRLEAFMGEIANWKQQQKDAGNEPGWLDTAKALGTAAFNNPAGAGLMIAEQLPNSAVSLGTGYAGMKAGGMGGFAVAGPPGALVGGIAGGIAGLFVANVGLETGNKALDAASAGPLSDDQRSDIIGQGLRKGGVITGIDAATLGVTSAIGKATAKAMERATVRTLTDAGVNVADRAAVLAARSNPRIVGAVQEAQKVAKAASTTLGQRAIRGGAAVALETFGEGAGEYLGEYAATGQFDKMEAMIEAFSSMGTSVGEIAATSAWNKKGQQDATWADAPAPAATPEATAAAITAPNVTSVDQAIAATQAALTAGSQWQELARAKEASAMQSQLAQAEINLAARTQEQAFTQAERAGAEASQARDQRLNDIGQQWQALGITDPADDLQAQRMGMRSTESTNGAIDGTRPIPATSVPAGSADVQTGVGTGLDAGAGAGAQSGGVAASNVGVAGQLPSGRTSGAVASSPAELRKQLDTVEFGTQAHADLLEAIHTATQQDATKAIESGTMPVYAVGNGMHVALSPSAQNKGQFQITRYSPKGIMSDSQYSSIEQAVTQEGLSHKVRLDDKAASDVIMKSAEAESKYQDQRLIPVSKRQPTESTNVVTSDQAIQSQPSQAPVQAEPVSRADIPNDQKPDATPEQVADVNEAEYQQSIKEEIKQRLGLAPAPEEDQRKTPFKSFLREHGIASAHVSDIAGRNRFRANQMLPATFRANGLSLDDLVERASERGFMQESDRGDHNKLIGMIQDEIAGKKQVSSEFSDEDAAAQHERVQRMEIEALADKLGLPYSTDISTDRLASMVNRVQSRLEKEVDISFNGRGSLKSDRVLKNAQETVARIERKRAQYERESKAFAQANIAEQDALLDILTNEDGQPVIVRIADSKADQAWLETNGKWEDQDGQTDHRAGSNNEENSASSARQPEEGSGNGDRTGTQEQRGSDQAPAGQEEGLTSYTPEDVKAEEARLAQIAKDKAKADKDADEKAKAERIAKEIAARQRASSDNFQLGQSAEEGLSGQGSIFDAPAEPKAKAVTPAKAVEMKSSEVKADTSDSHEFRLEVEKIARERYSNKEPIPVDVNSTKDKIYVSWASAKHILRDGLPDWKTSLAVLHMEELAKNAQERSDLKPDYKGRKDPSGIYVYKTSAKFDGVDHSIEITVRQHTDGKRYYDHLVVESKTPAGLPESSTASTSAGVSPTPPFAGVDSSVAQPTPESKPAEPAAQATAILDAANVTGKERIDVLKDVKNGDITPDELQAAYPAKDGNSNPTPAYDASRAQELKNDIAEGESILRSKSNNGRKYSPEELATVQRSVDSSKAKLAALGDGGATRRSFAGRNAATADTHALSTAQARLDASDAARKQIRNMDKVVIEKANDGGALKFKVTQDGIYLDRFSSQTEAEAFVSSEHDRMRDLVRQANKDSAEAVRKDTGWFKGSDGKMRFEINDKDAKLKINLETLAAFSGRLEDAVDHPALFSAYPELRNLRTTIQYNINDAGGKYLPNEKAISIEQSSPDGALSVLLHEIQHGIQHIEGFANGGNPTQFKNVSSDDVAKLLKQELKTAQNAKAYNSWFLDSPETPTAAQQKAIDRVKAARRAIKAFDETGVDPRVATSQEQYQKLAGEVEARNVQARQNFTDEERALMPAYTTQDVPDRDVIVVFNGKEMHNAPAPANAVSNETETTKPNSVTPQTPATQIREAINKAYGNLLGKLESKGLVTVTQTQEEAIDAAAQARADKTGEDIQSIKASMMDAVSNSKSAMKSIDANIRRGREALAKALNEKTTVHRAMFRNGMGWVDFVWGSEGTVKKNGNTKGAMGISHILEARQRKDGMTEQESIDLMDGVVQTVAKGREFDRVESGTSTRVGLVDSGIIVWMTKHAGSNAWIVTGYEADPDRVAAGRATATPTNSVTSRTRDGEGAGSDASIDKSGIDIKRSADGNVQGFYDPQSGQSFMIADNLTTDAAPGVLMHEVGIHMAASGAMQPVFDRASTLVKLGRDQFLKDVRARMESAGETSGEEAAAYITEAYEKDRVNAPASVVQWVKDLLAAVRVWAYKNGILIKADQLTPADIAAIARANAKSMANGGKALSRDINSAVTKSKDVVGNQGGRSADDTTPGTDENTGLPLNADGTVTVYHHTSAANAASIRKTGTLKAQAEPDVYVTTRKETDTGYGDTAVAIRVNPEKLSIDDEFPDGRIDFRLNVGKPGGSIKVAVENESTAPDSGGAMPDVSDKQTGISVALLELGKLESLYQYPKSDKIDIEGIAGDKGMTVSDVDRNAEDGKLWMIANTTPNDAPGVKSWIVTLPGGQHATLTDKHGEVYINVSSIGEGNGGSRIYDLASNYAYNNGLKFIGDPNGVSAAAMRRRLENMLSASIKYGTTDFLEPHADQLEGNESIGVPPLKWTEGDTLANIRAMVDVSVASTSATSLIGSTLAYDTTTNTFKDGTGQVVDGRESFEALAGFDSRVKRTGQAGRTTLQRNAVFNSLLSGANARRSFLESVHREQDQRSTGIGKATRGIFYSRTKIVGQTNRQHTPEQLRAMKNVGFQVEVPTLKERAQALWKDAGKKMAQGIADQFAPIKDLNKEAYGLMRLAKGASGAFEVLLKGGQLKLTDNVYDTDTANKGGVVDKLLIPLQGEHHDFMRWVAANRAERLQSEGKENLFSPQDIADLKTLASGTAAFDYTIQNGAQAGTVTRDRTLIYADSLKTFNAFNKNVLDMAEQSGLIDGESRKLWEHEFYVPFYRVADDADGGVRGMNIKGGAVRQQAFKQLKGGKQALNADLLDNTLMNWAHLLDASAKNRGAKATIEAAEAMGIAVGGNQSTLQQMGSSINNKNGVVWFMDGGVKRYSLVDDPFVFTALTSLEYAGMRNPVMNAMGAMKHVLTIGVTASPFFKVRNLIRDSVQVIGTGNISYNPANNVAQGWKLTDPKSDAYFRLLAGGGTIHFGTMMEGSEAKRVQALVESGVNDSTILNSDHKVKAFYRKWIEPGVTAYNELGNRGEAINRAALYDQLRKQGVNHADASLQARDLMDFSMQGSFTTIRFLTQVVPFLNARIQGLYKLGKSAKENPARFGAVVGATAVFSLLLLAAYSDDDDWKKRTESDRNNFWWFKFGGTAFRIPKPFEIGAIATLAERGFELAFDKEMTGTRFRKQVLTLLGDNLSMNPIPQAVKPILDVYANKDSFSGMPIESMGMDKLKSEYRFNDRTSMTARGMSTAANAVTGVIGVNGPSPVQIDHMLRGYFGWLGSFVVGSADLIARPTTGQVGQATPDYWRLATGNMVSDLRDAPSRYIAQMYDQAKKIEEVYGTWRMLQKTGKTQEAAEFMSENRETLQKYRNIEHVKRAEAKLNERIRIIERSNMERDAKRDLIRSIKSQKDRVARAAV